VTAKTLTLTLSQRVRESDPSFGRCPRRPVQGATLPGGTGGVPPSFCFPRAEQRDSDAQPLGTWSNADPSLKVGACAGQTARWRVWEPVQGATPPGGMGGVPPSLPLLLPAEQRDSDAQPHGPWLDDGPGLKAGACADQKLRVSARSPNTRPNEDNAHV
jgi:hypothetical protein